VDPGLLIHYKMNASHYCEAAITCDNANFIIQMEVGLFLLNCVFVRGNLVYHISSE
jgi:hypothetical protein